MLRTKSAPPPATGLPPPVRDRLGPCLSPRQSDLAATDPAFANPYLTPPPALPKPPPPLSPRLLHPTLSLGGSTPIPRRSRTPIGKENYPACPSPNDRDRPSPCAVPFETPPAALPPTVCLGRHNGSLAASTPNPARKLADVRKTSPPLLFFSPRRPAFPKAFARTHPPLFA